MDVRLQIERPSLYCPYCVYARDVLSPLDPIAVIKPGMKLLADGKKPEGDHDRLDYPHVRLKCPLCKYTEIATLEGKQKP
jgi:hypothetical protein